MFPNPGLGYTIKERLGAGNWKEAFRASNPFHGKDVALVFFRDKNEKKEAIREGSKLLELSGSDHPFAGYIAEFYGANYSTDKQIFFAEELLSQPLDRLGAVRSLEKLAQYSRDLCRGLDFLHSNNLVHRDLKLDNCGLSFGGRIKIFDLGSVTSELGEVKGTILTRAPEMFSTPNNKKIRSVSRKEVVATKEADVWALGATIYALKTGTYPFVLSNEIEERRQINEELKLRLSNSNEESEKEAARMNADSRKAEIDGSVSERILAEGAERNLMDKIDRELKGASGTILKSMLSFDPRMRKTAGSYASDWDGVLEHHDFKFRDHSKSVSATKIDHIKAYAIRISNREVSITDRQRQRLIEEIEGKEFIDSGELSKVGDIKKLLAI